MHEKNGEQVSVRIEPKQEIVSTINVIRGKLKDSLKATPGGKPGMVTISMNQTSVNKDGDAVKFDRHIQGLPGKSDRIFSLLYGVDSLQDSLRLTEIDSAYAKALEEEKLDT